MRIRQKVPAVFPAGIEEKYLLPRSHVFFRRRADARIKLAVRNSACKTYTIIFIQRRNTVFFRVEKRNFVSRGYRKDKFFRIFVVF